MQFARRTTLVLIVLVSLLFMTGLSHATIIKETWTGTVTGVSGLTDSSIINSTFTVTAIYDDTSDVMHHFSDGVNNIADFGEGDDSVFETYCTDTASGNTGCTFNYGTSWDRFADADINLNELIALLVPGQILYDFNNTNKSWAQGNNTETWLDYSADAIRFLASDNGTSSESEIQIIGPNAITQTYGLFATYTVSSVQIAEPSSIALMGLVLLGFFASRQRI